MRPVFNSFAPNTRRQDLITIFGQLLPWRFFNKSYQLKQQQELRQTIANYFNSAKIILTDSGRTALKELLTAYNFPPDSKVVIQAFTCSIVPHAILRAGYKPIYCDIDSTYNLDPEILNQLCQSEKPKAIIVQHTFGIPADLTAIQKIAKANNCIIIEDLAHGLGAKYNNQPIGTYGDSAILSFGSDKTISCSRGGAIVCHNTSLKEKLEHLPLPKPSKAYILKHLCQPIWFSIFKPLFDTFKIGKIVLFLLKTIGITPRVITKAEKQLKGNPRSFTLAGPLCHLVLKQWLSLNDFVIHRQIITKIYEQNFNISTREEPSLLRFPLLVESRNKLLRKLKQSNIHLDTWYPLVVGPAGVNQSSAGYTPGSCPNAEKVTKNVINLPTHIGVDSKIATLIASTIKSL